MDFQSSTLPQTTVAIGSLPVADCADVTGWWPHQYAKNTRVVYNGYVWVVVKDDESKTSKKAPDTYVGVIPHWEKDAVCGIPTVAADTTAPTSTTTTTTITAANKETPTTTLTQAAKVPTQAAKIPATAVTTEAGDIDRVAVTEQEIVTTEQMRETVTTEQMRETDATTRKTTTRKHNLPWETGPGEERNPFDTVGIG